MSALSDAAVRQICHDLGRIQIDSEEYPTLRGQAIGWLIGGDVQQSQRKRIHRALSQSMGSEVAVEKALAAARAKQWRNRQAGQ